MFFSFCWKDPESAAQNEPNSQNMPMISTIKEEMENQEASQHLEVVKSLMERKNSNNCNCFIGPKQQKNKAS